MIKENIQKLIKELEERKSKSIERRRKWVGKSKPILNHYDSKIDDFDFFIQELNKILNEETVKVAYSVDEIKAAFDSMCHDAYWQSSVRIPYAAFNWFLDEVKRLADGYYVDKVQPQ